MEEWRSIEFEGSGRVAGRPKRSAVLWVLFAVVSVGLGVLSLSAGLRLLGAPRDETTGRGGVAEGACLLSLAASLVLAMPSAFLWAREWRRHGVAGVRFDADASEVEIRDAAGDRAAIPFSEITSFHDKPWKRYRRSALTSSLHVLTFARAGGGWWDFHVSRGEEEASSLLESLSAKTRSATSSKAPSGGAKAPAEVRVAEEGSGTSFAWRSPVKLSLALFSVLLLASLVASAGSFAAWIIIVDRPISRGGGLCVMLAGMLAITCLALLWKVVEHCVPIGLNRLAVNGQGVTLTKNGRGDITLPFTVPAAAVLSRDFLHARVFSGRRIVLMPVETASTIQAGYLQNLDRYFAFDFPAILKETGCVLRLPEFPGSVVACLLFERCINAAIERWRGRAGAQGP